MTPQPWLEPAWIRHSQLLLNSYAHWLGEELIDRTGSLEEQSEQLFHAPFVVVSHTTDDDPMLNYGNQQALLLWEMELKTLLQTPSRLTAEPMHQNERARLLERTTKQGYVDDYRGIRISASGRRFRIDRAIVWNLIDDEGKYSGQAATFDEWIFLDEE